MKKLIIYIINVYQKHISSWLSLKGINCKYYPTCSEYTKQAIKKHGIIKGRYIWNMENYTMQSFFKGRL